MKRPMAINLKAIFLAAACVVMLAGSLPLINAADQVPLSSVARRDASPNAEFSTRKKKISSRLRA